MSDLGDVTGRLARLSDAELATVVAHATATRRGLSRLHDTAETLIPPPIPEVSEPIRPEHSGIPGASEVTAPLSLPPAEKVGRARESVERPRHHELEAIRESLRRTIRPDR